MGCDSSSCDVRRPDLLEAAILDLTFSQVARFRPFQIVADRFVQATDRPRRHPGLTLAEAGPPAPFAAVEVETGDASTVRAGLASADGDFVGLVLHGDHLALEVRRRGGRPRSSAPRCTGPEGWPSRCARTGSPPSPTTGRAGSRC